MRCQYWLKQQNMESLKEFRGDFRELLKLGKENIYSKTNSFNYFEQNKGFDINNDGIITKAEMTKYFFIVP